MTAYNSRGDLPGLTVDTVVWSDEAKQLYLTARRRSGDGSSSQPVWAVELPTLDLGDRHRYDRTEAGYDRIAGESRVYLEGLGDDLDAVHAALSYIGRGLARFNDRMHLARLSVLGELGDASAIAQAHRRNNDATTAPGPVEFCDGSPADCDHPPFTRRDNIGGVHLGPGTPDGGK